MFHFLILKIYLQDLFVWEDLTKKHEHRDL